MRRFWVFMPVLVWLVPNPASAQKAYRLAHLSISLNSAEPTRRLMLPELAKLGFREGENLVFDARAADPAAMPVLVDELLSAKPDAIIAIGSQRAPGREQGDEHRPNRWVWS